jgi:peptidoglycan L-alanyl-D-glutamate endopeptidase CwlK
VREWGDRSKRVITEIDPRWHRVLDRVLQEVADISLLCGHRGQKEQNEAFENGFSKVRWPDGKHNKWPSLAVDLQPYPMPELEIKQVMALAYIAGRIIQIGLEEGLIIRWGGDWDRDGDLLDQNFDDLFHFEIVGELNSEDRPRNSAAGSDGSNSQD